MRRIVGQDEGFLNQIDRPSRFQYRVVPGVIELVRVDKSGADHRGNICLVSSCFSRAGIAAQARVRVLPGKLQGA